MNLKPKKRQLLRFLPNSLVLTRGPRNGAARYLTFDDGPNPEHTPRVLDLLAAHGAHASFFLIGEHAERHPALVERILAEGHTIGNHSYTHPVFAKQTWERQLDEIERTDRLLERFDGRARHGFRPPRGSFSLPLLLHFARCRRGIAYWSYDSLDYQHLPDEKIVARFQQEPPCASEIVLMHDDNDCAGRVLGAMLPQWLADGRELLALPPETQ